MKKFSDSAQGDFLGKLHADNYPHILTIKLLRRITEIDGRWSTKGIHSRLVNLINFGLVERMGTGKTRATPAGAKRKKHVPRLDGLTGIKRKQQPGLFTVVT